MDQQYVKFFNKTVMSKTYPFLYCLYASSKFAAVNSMNC